MVLITISTWQNVRRQVAAAVSGPTLQVHERGERVAVQVVHPGPWKRHPRLLCRKLQPRDLTEFSKHTFWACCVAKMSVRHLWIRSFLQLLNLYKKLPGGPPAAAAEEAAPPGLGAFGLRCHLSQRRGLQHLHPQLGLGRNFQAAGDRCSGTAGVGQQTQGCCWNAHTRDCSGKTNLNINRLTHNKSQIRKSHRKFTALFV